MDFKKYSNIFCYNRKYSRFIINKEYNRLVIEESKKKFNLCDIDLIKFFLLKRLSISIWTLRDICKYSYDLDNMELFIFSFCYKLIKDSEFSWANIAIFEQHMRIMKKQFKLCNIDLNYKNYCYYFLFRFKL